MGTRVHAVFTEAWHLVLAVIAAGAGVAGIAALVGYLAGRRGGHDVVVAVIAVGVVGVLCILTAASMDPMGFSASAGRWRSPAAQGTVMEEMEHGEAGLPADLKARFRRDDVLYAGGVLLIGLAVLLGYLCTWSGVPPSNPFG